MAAGVGVPMNKTGAAAIEEGAEQLGLGTPCCHSLTVRLIPWMSH